MLSNPSNLHPRQQRHRRQQSTPTAFNNSKVSSLPTIQRNGSHRRGMSLDQRPQRQSPPQEHTVINTNQGFQHVQQHILREAQQQRLVRQGQQMQAPYFNMTNDENYLISPLVSPQRQQFDTGCVISYDGLTIPPSHYSQYPGHINTTSRVNPNDCSGSSPFGDNDSLMFQDSGNLTPSAYLDFSGGYDDSSCQQDWGATIRPTSRSSPTRRISGGIADRVARFEGMTAEQSATRPITPPNQSTASMSYSDAKELQDIDRFTDYFPPTPAHTPYNRLTRTEPMPQRFFDNYDTSMEETIRPARNRSNQRAKNVFQEMRDHSELNRPLSPPRTAPMPSASTFDSARMPTSDSIGMSSAKLDYSPRSSNMDPELSQPSSPEIDKLSLMAAPFEIKPELESHGNLGYLQTAHPGQHMRNPISPAQSSPMERAMSDDSLNLEETITDTGITIDDIATYIEGPDPVDQKWLCLYPDCKKRFGRKENIKSHVQTHLGDRQYRCPFCKKCFVRQHDLKRHAKIHSGVKPYPCACGNSFARHDALTRHRQRGMCIGAFEGVVKKVVKRGRPPKNRPDAEKRQDKAARTRNKNKAMSSASSTSAYSESSEYSPRADFDVLDDKPFGDMASDYSQSSAMMDNSAFTALSPAPSLPTTCISPQVIQSAGSPSAYSSHSHQSYHSTAAPRGSVASIPEHQLPRQSSSPGSSHVSMSRENSQSQYNTPPELCLSSSSPPASGRFYDIPETGDDLDFSKMTELQAVNDDQMFLDAFVDTNAMNYGMTRLEQDPDILLMGGKFDDAFAGVVDHGEMFGATGDDVFFGSP